MLYAFSRIGSRLCCAIMLFLFPPFFALFFAEDSSSVPKFLVWEISGDCSKILVLIWRLLLPSIMDSTRETFVSAVVSLAVVSVIEAVLGWPVSVFGWKNSCYIICEGRGLFLGLYCSIHSIKLIASAEALGKTLFNDTFLWSGIVNIFLSARRFASGQSSLSGLPRTREIFSN